jgi:hypothetical protein
MPGLDRTGPEGKGPRTGRQMGKCAPPGNQKERGKNDDNAPVQEPPTMDPEEFEGKGFGRLAGRGLGRGAGRGTGRGMGRGVGRNRRRKRGN